MRACAIFPCVSQPQSIPTQDERTFALLAHLLQIIAGWLGALIILLVRRESRFVSFHALQVLLLQLAHFALMVVFGLCGFFIFFLFALAPHGQGPSPMPFLFFPMFMLAWFGPWVAIVVMGIVYGVRANQGEWAEYPILGQLARRILHHGPGGTSLDPTAST
jgi:uncharacterized membrane protein